MSDNIPLDIQVQILKKLPVRSVLQFRSVSKTWKSLIDSPQFITSYSAQGTQVQHLLVNTDYGIFYKENKYYLMAEDDSFPQHKVSVPLPDNSVEISDICGCSHGLLCFIGCSQKIRCGHISPTSKAVIWNPSIRKAVSVVVPNVRDGMYEINLGFGVCSGTTDPKIVKIRHIKRWADIESIASIPQQVEVFTLSTRGWRSSYGNLPRKTIEFNDCQRVEEVGGLLYWLATDRIAVCSSPSGFESYDLIVSFDLTSEEFTEVKIPDSLANMAKISGLIVYKLRESIAVVHHQWTPTGDDYSTVWMMEDGVSKSFTKMFTLNMPDTLIRGFRKSGEPLVETEYLECDGDHVELAVCDPHSKQIGNLLFDEYGQRCKFLVFPYIETLLLLDHPNLIVYNDI